MRKAETVRKTGETDITLSLDIDGKGESEISSGVGFLDHMLTLFSRHGRFDLCLKCIGDTYVDDNTDLSFPNTQSSLAVLESTVTSASGSSVDCCI